MGKAKKIFFSTVLVSATVGPVVGYKIGKNVMRSKCLSEVLKLHDSYFEAYKIFNAEMEEKCKQRITIALSNGDTGEITKAIDEDELCSEKYWTKMSVLTELFKKI